MENFMSNTLWNFLAPADRETFISGTLAWLMDYNGDHSLKNEFLNKMLSLVHNKIKDSDIIEITPEESFGTGKRFDISVKVNGDLFVVFEVKCKTTGSKKQLERYSKDADVIRISFDEWNFPDLDEQERQKYPLIKFSYVIDYLKKCKSFRVSPYYTFLENFSTHLVKESEYFESLINYFINETTEDIPKLPNFHRYSQRFYNMLYWNWFKEKISSDNTLSMLTPNSRSESSGVWFSLTPEIVESGNLKKFNSLDLELPGKFWPWIHIELANKTGIISENGEIVGYIQLRLCDEDDREKIFQMIKNANTALDKHKFLLRSRKPSNSSNYYSAFKRELSVEEFRYSNLIKIINLLL